MHALQVLRCYHSLPISVTQRSALHLSDGPVPPTLLSPDPPVKPTSAPDGAPDGGIRIKGGGDG